MYQFLRRRFLRPLLVCGWALLLCFGFVNPVQAALDDDRFDGNIFVLYAGNGSLVPPRTTLAASLATQKPALLVFYADDSSDCKRFAGVVSQLQSFYGRATNIIPVGVDSLMAEKYAPSEPGYYYKGKIPQTVLIDQKGKVAYQSTGTADFNEIDDAFRKVFDRPVRAKEDDMEQRSFNEFNSEMGR
jgi:thiol-disulfide isomerase/thioredoxin